MILFHLTMLISAALGGIINFPCLEELKYIQDGENITLNCPFSTFDAITTLWLKQTPGEKPLLIASAFRSTTVKYHNGFDKSGRFNALQEKSSVILNIFNSEPSDSATYYCATADYSDAALLDCTILVLKGTPSSHYTVLQPPTSDAVEPGGNTTLQCSVLTDTSAGEHSVYWFRHRSGESHPGIIYTHGNRSDQCEKSSETGSPTHSCVYKLTKRNLSLSDVGTYYCAVALCGEIIFGNGTKLDIVENNVVLDPTIIVLAVSNIISMVLVLFLGRKLHHRHHKDAAESHTVQVNQDEGDGLNYAALSFTNKTPSSRRTRTQQNLKDAEVYSQVKFPQESRIS